MYDKTFPLGCVRFYLPVRRVRDIFRATISTWVIAYVKLAFSKLISRDISRRRITAHDLRAFSSFWAYLSKDCQNDILRAVVRNRPTILTILLERYVQAELGISLLGQVIAAQKGGGHLSFHNGKLKPALLTRN